MNRSDVLPMQDELEQSSWRKVELVLVAIVTVLVAMRTNLTHQITLGSVFALLLLPAWLPSARRYLSAPMLLGLGFAAAFAGILLTFINSRDHEVGLGTMFDNTVLLVGLLASFGFLLWAREQLGDGALITFYGIGAVLGVSHSDPLYSRGIWKFGYATAVTILVLGLAHLIGKKMLELAIVLALVLAAALTDYRSAFGLLLLVAAFLAWQMRPMQQTRVGSAFRGALALSLGSVLAYFVGQTLILEGYLGETTRARSIEQINESGSLIVGGRPEMAATVALMRDNIWGFGSGTRINHHDLSVAKTGMAAINYDPNNGYVERYMFGNTYGVHSVIGDLWTRFGLVGLALGLLMLFLVMRWVSQSVTTGAASAALLFLASRTLWNLFFSPWYFSVGLLALTLALVVDRRQLPMRANRAIDHPLD